MFKKVILQYEMEEERVLTFCCVILCCITYEQMDYREIFFRFIFHESQQNQTNNTLRCTMQHNRKYESKKNGQLICKVVLEGLVAEYGFQKVTSVEKSMKFK